MTIQADAGKTVLVVDDSKVSRMVIKAHILAMHPHWQVVEAGTGDEAVELGAGSVPDYCTVDVNMPGMPGTDAAALRLCIISVAVAFAALIASEILSRRVQARLRG